MTIFTMPSKYVELDDLYDQVKDFWDAVGTEPEGYFKSLYYVNENGERTDKEVRMLGSDERLVLTCGELRMNNLHLKRYDGWEVRKLRGGSLIETLGGLVYALCLNAGCDLIFEDEHYTADEVTDAYDESTGELWFSSSDHAFTIEHVTQWHLRRVSIHHVFSELV